MACVTCINIQKNTSTLKTQQTKGEPTMVDRQVVDINVSSHEYYMPRGDGSTAHSLLLFRFSPLSQIQNGIN